MPELYFYSGFSVSSHRLLHCDIKKILLMSGSAYLAALPPSIDDGSLNESLNESP